MEKLRIIIFYVLILFTFIANGQSEDVTFRRLSTKDGLSQNDIRFIYQDSRGFIWIGTYDGLNRFDGYSFKIFRTGHGASHMLGSNLVSCITEDRNGNLWIGTDDTGIYYFDRQKETFSSFRNNTAEQDLLTSNQVTELHIEKDEYLWVATPFGLNRIKISSLFEGEPATRHFFSDPQNASFQNIENRVWKIFSDKFSNLWFGIPQGLLRFVPGKNFYEGEQFISYLGDLNSTFRNSNGVVDIAEGEEGLLLAAGGLLHLDYDQINKSNPSFDVISTLNCQRVHYDFKGNIWAGTADGLLQFEMTGKKVASVHRYRNNWLDETSMSKNIITAIHEDKTNIIWIGTNGGGINIYNPFKKKFKHFKKTENAKSLSYNKIRGVYEDQFENLWVGTEGGGLNFLPAENKNDYSSGFHHLNVHPTGTGENFGYAFAELILSPQKSSIWAGVGVPTSLTTAIIKENGKPDEITLAGVKGMTNSAFALIPDYKGGMWVGTYGEGLFKFSMDAENNIELDFHYINDPEVPTTISSNIIRSLCIDADSNLWIGTSNGINKLIPSEQDKENPTFILYQHDNRLENTISHDYIMPIFRSSTENIWIGTMGGGLNILVKGDQDDNDTFEAITVTDGLPNNTIKGILEDDHQNLWISSNKGLTKYNPQEKSFTNYDMNDGLQDNEFSEMACYERKSGEMVFGGVNGFNVFYPDEIVVDDQDTKIVFTELQVLNNVVEIGEKINGRVLLAKSITETKEVKLKYSERSFTLGFAGLHFGAPAKNKYAYKLDGFDKDWINVGADMRSARYTNLSPGKYTFMVKGSNGDGFWSSKTESLLITIITPIWQSKFAFVFYVIMFGLILWFFRRYSIIAVREKNQLLLEHFEKEKVEELSQMKLRFFTNISHEFRTPLTLIIGPLEKLISETKNFTKAELKNQYSIMYRNAKVLLSLINQLMDFRKLEQGKMKLKVTKSDVVKFFEVIRASFSELAKNKKIRLVLKSELVEPMIWFDRDKLEKVIYNLLSNAFKHTPEGGSISIDISDQLEKGNLQIRISDTGSGIPKHIQSHLFERFYQFENPAARQSSGTGIGLSFVKGLVELHHGKITFNSVEGKGTKFTIILPVQKSEYAKEEIYNQGEFIAPDESHQSSWLDESPIIDGEAKVSKTPTSEVLPKILIIEDNPDIRMYLRDALSDNFTMFEAENGQQGLDICLEKDPDFVISDVMMPVMDGFEFCEKVKTDERTNHIPVILLTAKDTKEDQIKGYEFGADDYVSKPFNMEVLLARINNIIESRSRFQENFKKELEIDPSDSEITSIDQRILNRLISIIEENISDPEFTVEKLAKEYGIGQMILNKKLKAIVNKTARAFIRTIRLKRAAQLLSKGRYSIADVTYEVGFNDLKYFRDCFKKEFSVTPSEYLNQSTTRNSESSAED